MLKLIIVSSLLIISPIFSLANPVLLTPLLCTGPQGLLCVGAAEIATIGALSVSQGSGTSIKSKAKATDRAYIIDIECVKNY